MSSSDRRRFVLGLAALAAVAACGFAPAYGPGGPARALLGQVAVDAPTDRDSFDFVERLEERLGRAKDGAYRLSYEITTGANGAAITPDNAITRYHLVGTASFRLTDAGGVAVTSGEVTNFTSYAATGTTVSTLSTEQDAHLRLMRLLADQIVSRLVATSGQWAPGGGTP